MAVNNIEKEKAKEVSRKKRSNFIKRIKKIYSKVVNKVKSIDKKTKLIIAVWLVILLIICLLALLVTTSNASRKKYYDMEKSMDNAVLNYVRAAGVYPVKDSKANIPLESLLLGNYIFKKDIADDSCKGYSIVYYNGDEEQYVVESYISCDEYTTKYYSDYIE
jgi:hypothetical protein